MQPAQRTKHTRILAGLTVAGLAACGGREVPAAWPDESAASPAAPAAPAALVTQSLSEAPPLPGEASSWAGLDAAPPPGAHDHAGHGSSDHGSSGHGSSGHGPVGQERAGHDAGHSPAGPDADVVRYVCPMHPDVVADRPGTCPRCGMALVKRDAPK